MRRQLHEEQERARALDEDLEHDAHPDAEMVTARLDVDPYAPAAPAEVEPPETICAAVWEGLFA